MAEKENNKQKQKCAKGVSWKEGAGSKSIIRCMSVVQFWENEISGGGYINIDLKKSKSGKLFAVINDWKPDKK